MFESFKNKILKFVLRKNAQRKTRNVTFQNLYSAKKIGIVADGTDALNVSRVKSFITSLKQRGSQVECLAFYNESMLPPEISDKSGFHYFTRKDRNWYGKPQGKFVEDFLKMKFDILFDLTIKERAAIEYIMQMANADFKAGALKKDKNAYDFMIDIRQKQELAYLIDQIKFYLSTIDRP